MHKARQTERESNSWRNLMGVRMFGNHPDLNLRGWINVWLDLKLSFVCNGVYCMQRGGTSEARRECKTYAWMLTHALVHISSSTYILKTKVTSNTHLQIKYMLISDWEEDGFFLPLNFHLPLKKTHCRWWSQALFDFLCYFHIFEHRFQIRSGTCVNSKMSKKQNSTQC